MPNAERGASYNDRDHGGCPHCDPGLLDELKCKAKGIQKQAEYNAEHEKELDNAHTEFMAARAAYNAARSDAEPHVADARRQLEDLEDRVRCQLDSDDIEHIDTAFGRVVERLNRCGDPDDCCCDEDCDYDDAVRDCDPDDVPGRMAVIKRRTKEATECFLSLIGEYIVLPPPESTPLTAAPTTTAPTTTAPTTTAPTTTAPTTTTLTTTAATPTDTPLAGLPGRVKALQEEIAAISKAVAGDSWTSAHLYAAVLVARRHLRKVWRGFPDVNEYMECLCRALTCMIKGHAAIGELTRQAAVNQCYHESWKAACKHLGHNTVEEVLAEYLRVCAETDEEGRPDSDRRRGQDRGPDRARVHSRERGHERRRDRGDGHDQHDDHDRHEGNRDDDHDRHEGDRDDDHDRHEGDRDDDHDRHEGNRDDDHERVDYVRARQRPLQYRDVRGRYRAP